VGTREDQQRFAKEVLRVGKRYWIQTPNRGFPIEPHFNFPFFGALPFWARKIVARQWPLSFLWKCKRGNEGPWLRRLHLLNTTEMQALFPDGVLWKEKVLGLAKSIVMYRK
jgi:hypothetical protein